VSGVLVSYLGKNRIDELEVGASLQVMLRPKPDIPCILVSRAIHTPIGSQEKKTSKLFHHICIVVIHTGRERGFERSRSRQPSSKKG
jgi:hypothetical protein